MGNYICLERPLPRGSIFRSLYDPVSKTSNHTPKLLATLALLALFLKSVVAPARGRRPSAPARGRRPRPQTETAAAAEVTARAWAVTDLGSGEY